MPATSAGAGRQTVADITTTTKKTRGAAVSELAKTIERLELWADYWTPHQPPEFIADLKVLIGAAKAVSRAVEVLQRAQRYAPENAGEMEACSQGDWIPIDDVVKVIQILQEGQQ